ncbi:hypothetical protein G6F43_013521 [Rhizopus delemar]|nr:hypothetical protein G6F43_013521 [Rhizopus delemar]
METVIENSKRLAIFGLATAKTQEREAKAFADKALNFPITKSSLKIFIKQDLNKNYFNKVRLQAEEEDMEISNEAEVVGQEEKDHEVLFLDREPQTNGGTTITQTKTTNPTTTTSSTTVPLNTPGGRLQTFYHSWTEITTHQWPLSVVKDGFKIQFHHQPTPWRLRQIRPTDEDQSAVDEAVQKFLATQIIELSPSQHTGFLSNFFTIQETNKRRPILDCQMINRFIQCHHFKMEGVPALRDILEEKDYILSYLPH